MKSITIHNLESDLAELIEELAARKGYSQNKLIKSILRQALSLDDLATVKRKKYFEKIFGTMSEKAAEQFFRDTADLEKVDASQW